MIGLGLTGTIVLALAIYVGSLALIVAFIHGGTRRR